MQTLRRRVLKIWRTIEAEPYEAVALVTHRTVLKVLFLHLAGLPTSHFFRYAFAPASVTHLERRYDAWTIHRFNHTCHLRGRPV